MNRFLISSAIIGAALGVGHGHTSRASGSFDQSLPMEAAFCVRDSIVGAIVYPFILPIGIYQIATKQEKNGCMFQALFHRQKKSYPHEETSPLK